MINLPTKFIYNLVIEIGKKDTFFVNEEFSSNFASSRRTLLEMLATEISKNTMKIYNANKEEDFRTIIAKAANTEAICRKYINNISCYKVYQSEYCYFPWNDVNGFVEGVSCALENTSKEEIQKWNEKEVSHVLKLGLFSILAISTVVTAAASLYAAPEGPK